MRIRTICSRKRTRKQLQCACMLHAPHLKFYTTIFIQTQTYFYKIKNWPMQQTCSKIIYMRVVFEFVECSHCPRNTICAKDKHQNNCNMHVFLMLHTKTMKMIKKSTKTKNIFLKKKSTKKHKYIILKHLLCNGHFLEFYTLCFFLKWFLSEVHYLLRSIKNTITLHKKQFQTNLKQSRK